MSQDAAAKAAIAALLATCAGLAQANEWPALSYGMWNFVRTITSGTGGGQSIANKKCMNPTDDMKREHQKSVQPGCTVSPVSKSGNAYVFVTACRPQGQAVESKSTLIVEGDSAYRIRVESKAAGQTKTESLVATRSGDC
jgi:hypothetical protein